MKKFPMYGVIDIGSNAARILFANVVSVDNEFIVYKNSFMRIPLRLGQDVYEKGKISPKKIRILIDTLKVFESLVRIYKPLDFAVYATSAIRESSNSTNIFNTIKNKTGFSIKIIDGLEEARIIKELYEKKGRPEQYKLMADLGGGSFELAILSSDGSFVCESFKIGALRILNEGVSYEELTRMNNWLDENLPTDRSKIHFIGTGGNINSMKSHFSSSKVKFLTIDDIYAILKTLKPLTMEERILNHKLKPERADVIIPASKLFIEFMKFIKVDKIYVPGGGLSDGIVLQLHKKNMKIN